jgi:hypothetical protein
MARMLGECVLAFTALLQCCGGTAARLPRPLVRFTMQGVASIGKGATVGSRARRSRSSRRALAAVGLLLAMGCNPLLTVDGGYFAALSERPGREGVAANLRVGMFDDSQRTQAFGTTLGFRTKFSARLTQFALSQDMWLEPVAHHFAVRPYLRAGINSYQFESLDGSFAYGMFSPYAEAGWVVRVTELGFEELLLTLGGAIEYDLRFTDHPDEGYWSALVGLALSGLPRPPAEAEWPESEAR